MANHLIAAPRVFKNGLPAKLRNFVRGYCHPCKPKKHLESKPKTPKSISQDPASKPKTEKSGFPLFGHKTQNPYWTPNGNRELWNPKVIKKHLEKSELVLQYQFSVDVFAYGKLTKAEELLK